MKKGFNLKHKKQAFNLSKQYRQAQVTPGVSPVPVGKLPFGKVFVLYKPGDPNAGQTPDNYGMLDYIIFVREAITLSDLQRLINSPEINNIKYQPQTTPLQVNQNKYLITEDEKKLVQPWYTPYDTGGRRELNVNSEQGLLKVPVKLYKYHTPYYSVANIIQSTGDEPHDVYVFEHQGNKVEKPLIVNSTTFTFNPDVMVVPIKVNEVGQPLQRNGKFVIDSEIKLLDDYLRYEIVNGQIMSNIGEVEGYKSGYDAPAPVGQLPYIVYVSLSQLRPGDKFYYPFGDGYQIHILDQVESKDNYYQVRVEKGGKTYRLGKDVSVSTTMELAPSLSGKENPQPVPVPETAKKRKRIPKPGREQVFQEPEDISQEEPKNYEIKELSFNLSRQTKLGQSKSRYLEFDNPSPVVDKEQTEGRVSKNYNRSKDVQEVEDAIGKLREQLHEFESILQSFDESIDYNNDFLPLEKKYRSLLHEKKRIDIIASRLKVEGVGNGEVENINILLEKIRSNSTNKPKALDRFKKLEISPHQKNIEVDKSDIIERPQRVSVKDIGVWGWFSLIATGEIYMVVDPDYLKRTSVGQFDFEGRIRRALQGKYCPKCGAFDVIEKGDNVYCNKCKETYLNPNFKSWSDNFIYAKPVWGYSFYEPLVLNPDIPVYSRDSDRGKIAGAGNNIKTAAPPKLKEDVREYTDKPFGEVYTDAPLERHYTPAVDIVHQHRHFFNTIADSPHSEQQELMQYFRGKQKREALPAQYPVVLLPEGSVVEISVPDKDSKQFATKQYKKVNLDIQNPDTWEKIKENIRQSKTSPQIMIGLQEIDKDGKPAGKVKIYVGDYIEKIKAKVISIPGVDLPIGVENQNHISDSGLSSFNPGEQNVGHGDEPIYLSNTIKKEDLGIHYSLESAIPGEGLLNSKTKQIQESENQELNINNPNSDEYPLSEFKA